MSKIYLLENVYEAALKRLDFVKNNFDRVAVAFSGGKDSTLTLHTAMEVIDDLDVYFWDKESNLLSIRDYILDTFDSNQDKFRPHWFCLPFEMRNALSIYEPYWICWNKPDQHKWIYQPPDRDYIVREDDQPFEKHDIKRHNLYKLFAEKLSEGGKYRTAILVGLRTDESLNRFRAVTKNPQFGQNWIAKSDAKNCYNVYPVYDWDFADIWTYFYRNQIPYASIYDKMFQVGMLKRNMRVSQSFCDVSKQGIPIIRECEPESFERFMDRVAGMNSLTHIDLGDVLKKAKSVQFDFLMQLYPENVRDQIQKRLERTAMSKDDENVIKALLNNDIRLKRVNRTSKTQRATNIKARYADI